MINELVLKNRSYRRFDEKVRFSRIFVESIVDLARLSPSSRNQQALKFKIITEPDECNKLFPCLAWAGYLPEWAGPAPGERPSSYVIILGDKTLGQSFSIDLGICAQSMLLGFVDKGFGGCMIGSLKKEEIKKIFKFKEEHEILLVLALGKPVENIVLEPVKDGGIKYWRDENGIHHVPKRDLKDLIV